ncbi:MAG: hypothetical protein GW779_03830 [Candidatus Altiarchaeum hamiconexum]|uniref:Uncharacterized protein n=1 Tax=Candidatus Altarchaeum hamiconexum TaxID=1803513 RepID=A0A8J7YVN2_9ARCH|nr:hypothetical protein [Candidatus Altarchaeum hamiconexum]OIQ05132.1 MAG: hypothetical protein AUK59_05045 [Candidatus Altarchaeum sp. CG2_30_32_3053]PIN67055.1 MAG: hypothetical protein COV98_04985 [Candidatus Altarchaeum sp. CG12_big_fil_rev_8_21_14_0_65_33_22]PIV28720.1 MAG: hypothetical protein COS36_01270 [Candidatus Altarchaeum sp. CG03_land_8_20_14_0_80_32_618]PIX48726.1 MAG: hypothetical protein COZ53_03115 [Candidatus Altarchaeum sp. CG_4_8_14_3_um_filter_33_2054]PIZ29823.1 MAG: hyp
MKLTSDLAVIVNELINRGYSVSKEDLIRASIISYGACHGIISPKILHEDVLRKIKAGGKKYTDDEIAKQVENL